jgi:outer membrane immunogenic protein
VAGDFDWSDIKGSGDHLNAVGGGGPGTRNFHINYAYQWLASLTGRVGYVANNWLLYFKGGAAWAHRDANSNVTNTVTGATVVTATTAGKTVTGWTIGGGVEWQFVPHWSAFLEYDYVDLGTKTSSVLVTFALPGAAPVVTGAVLSRDVDSQLSLLKVGINYRF